MPEDSQEPEKTPNFEDALTELEQIVERLERGDISLEAALADFERGIGLVRHCTGLLNTMEMRVEKLLVTNDGEIVTEPFDQSRIEHATNEE